MYRMGSTVTLTVTLNEIALENYGEQYRNVKFKIVHKADKYMPAQEFYAKGMPNGFHPGYDEMSGRFLFDLQDLQGNDLPYSVYEWELE